MARPLAGLRVAYAAFDPFPNLKGSGTRIARLATALAGAGAEVTLLTLPGTCRIDLPHGVVLRPLRIVEDNYLCRALAFRDAVARELVALAPDVVHFRGPFEGQAAVAYARTHRARSLFEVNGLPSVELRYHYPAVATAASFEGKLRRAEEALLLGAGAVITQSRATERFLALRGMPAGRSAVIANAADPLPLSGCAHQSSGAPRVLYVGTLAPWQGLPDLLVAMRRAGRTVDLRLDVVGWGQKRWRRWLERRARRLKVDDRVAFHGAVPRSELAGLVAASDICAAPLRRDRRNRVQGCSPIKLFEYMAAGRAVLATSLPCLQEIVRDGETGILARASHTSDLSARLVDLATDAALRARLGARARKELAESATWEHRAAELVAFYRERLLASEYSAA